MQFSSNRISAAIVAAVMGLATPAFAAVNIFENWNTAACSLTDTATFTVNQPVHLDAIELWYRWGAEESSVQYTVLFNGQTIGDGTLTRSACDPYQPAWCIARDELGADLVAGSYTIKVQRAQVCQNQQSGGQGFVRAFGSQR